MVSIGEIRDGAEGVPIHPPELYSCQEIAQGIEGFEAVTDDELARYAAQGYLVIHSAFTATEVDEAKQGLLDLIAGRKPEFDWIEVEALAKERWPELTGEERQDSVRKLMDFTRFDARLLAMSDHPQLLALIQRLLGATPERFQDMALIKPPEIGREKPWHQDCAYFDLPLGTKVIGVWIALDEATVANGCMHLLAGGHLEGPKNHFQRRDWQICDTEMLGRSSVAVPLKPGGCLIFDGMMPHGTPHNLSKQRRRALQFHYRAVGTPAVAQGERLAVFGGEGLGVSC